MQRRAGRVAGGEERTDLVIGLACSGRSDSASPPCPWGHGCERGQQNATPRAHTTGSELPYGSAQEPHILRMNDTTCCWWPGCGEQGKKRHQGWQWGYLA